MRPLEKWFAGLSVCRRDDTAKINKWASAVKANLVILSMSLYLWISMISVGMASHIVESRFEPICVDSGCLWCEVSGGVKAPRWLHDDCRTKPKKASWDKSRRQQHKEAYKSRVCLRAVEMEDLEDTAQGKLRPLEDDDQLGEFIEQMTITLICRRQVGLSTGLSMTSGHA